MDRSHVVGTRAVGCAAAAGAIVALISPPSHAATVTGSFQVRIVIQPSCTITSDARAADGRSISVDCTDHTPYSIELVRSALERRLAAESTREAVTITVRY